MSHMTSPRPYQRQFVAVTCTFNLYIKFGVFAITNYKDAKGNAKCRNWCSLKWLRVNQDDRQHN